MRLNKLGHRQEVFESSDNSTFAEGIAQAMISRQQCTSLKRIAEVMTSRQQLVHLSTGDS